MSSDRYSFTNSDGQRLYGCLELPSATAQAFAVFAHGFTCSSKVNAATSISRALGEREIAVLRFDFTGLGDSEGEFANTHSSLDVDGFRLRFGSCANPRGCHHRGTCF